MQTAGLDKHVGKLFAAARARASSGVEHGYPGGRSTRQAAEQRGRLAELVAAMLLTLKGYRILDRRHRSRYGEIDLIAVRGQRLAFVEVKQRRTMEAAACAVGASQAARMADAVEHWLWRNPGYRRHTVGLDAVLLGPGFVPRHVPGALHGW